MSKQELRFVGEGDREPYHYRGCGLPDVYLLSGYEQVTAENGDGVVIKDMDGLHRAIGEYIAQHQKVLAGVDLRFLRKEMNLTQTELGTIMGVTSQTVARWEKGETEFQGPGDVLLRVLYMAHVGKKLDARVLSEQIAAIDTARHGKQLFKASRRGWKPTRAA
jgi:putative transcriptional regulator